MPNRNVDDIHHDIRIRRVSVAVGSVIHIVFRMFDLAFLNDFLTLDHATPAIGTAVLAFLPDRPAARAVRKILDLCARNLLLRRSRRTEAGTSSSNKTGEQNDEDNRRSRKRHTETVG